MGVLADLDISVFQLQDGPLGFNSYAQELKWLTNRRDTYSIISSEL